MNKLFNTFKLRLILLCMTLLAVVLTTVHAAVYITTKDLIETQFGLSSQSTAVAISKNIMGNIDAYKQFLETRDVNSDYYKNMQEYLASIKAVSNIKYIYTERRVDDETAEFILDAEPIGAPDYSPPGMTTFMDLASRSVYSTLRPAYLEPVEHPDYGTLLGACAPIFDTNGDVLGLVGINIEVSEVLAQFNKLQIVMVTIYVFIIVLSFLLLTKYSNTILEPMLKDKLTGAYNKRYLEKLMHEEINSAVKNNTDFAVMMLDLDHFKKINDTYGHAFGDIVLASVSNIIMGCLRKKDYFFRYGGEEFAVMITHTDIGTVQRIAERIRASVERSKISNDERNIVVQITISIGIAYLDEIIKKNWHGIIENADKALYDAKKTRNRTSVFESGTARQDPE